MDVCDDDDWTVEKKEEEEASHAFLSAALAESC